MFDYTFKLIKDSGESVETTYQSLIKKLGIEEMEVELHPMSAGGTPQAFFLRELMLKHTDGIAIEIYHNGNLIA